MTTQTSKDFEVRSLKFLVGFFLENEDLPTWKSLKRQPLQGSFDSTEMSQCKMEKENIHGGQKSKEVTNYLKDTDHHPTIRMKLAQGDMDGQKNLCLKVSKWKVEAELTKERLIHP